LDQIDEDVQELLWSIVQCVKAIDEEICQKRRHCTAERFERYTQGSLRSSSAIPTPEGPVNESISENERSCMFHQRYTQCILELYSTTATKSNNHPVSNQWTSKSRTNILQRAVAPGPDGTDPNGGGGDDDDDYADRRWQNNKSNNSQGNNNNNNNRDNSL